MKSLVGDRSSHCARRLLWIELSLFACSLLVMGCNSQPPPQVTKSVVVDVPKEPSQIELSDAKAVVNANNLVSFEVKYAFKKGKPLKFYLCEITFPNTESKGLKYMDGWELKESGVIKDGIELHSPTVSTFEIKMSEADRPEQGYGLISNVVTGKVEK